MISLGWDSSHESTVCRVSYKKKNKHFGSRNAQIKNKLIANPSQHSSTYLQWPSHACKLHAWSKAHWKNHPVCGQFEDQSIECLLQVAPQCFAPVCNTVRGFDMIQIQFSCKNAYIGTRHKTGSMSYRRDIFLSLLWNIKHCKQSE